MKKIFIMSSILMMPALTFAADGHSATVIDFTKTVYGYLGVFIFIAAYTLVPLENKIHLRKSKPVLLAAGLIWVLVAVAYGTHGDTHSAHEAIRYNLQEYAELFLFLLAAMTYINSMEERNVFQALRAWLVSRGFSLRSIFWITGLLAFFISPIADNLTTALLMGAVVMAVAGDNLKFVALACINVVVAANAGGAFSPFGDITTLMVWQKGKLAFSEFFAIFIPAAVNWLVPAIIMSFMVGKEPPKHLEEKIHIKYGGYVIIGLFLATIITAVSFHNFLHLPPAAGMMLGLGYLGLFAYYIKHHEGRSLDFDGILGTKTDLSYKALIRIISRSVNIDKFIDHVEEPTFAIDNNHVVTHWNQSCEDLTGVAAKDIIGTKDPWKAFYPSKRPVMADLVLDHQSEEVINNLYHQRFRINPNVPDTFDGSGFYPHLGESGKWLTFSALPLKDINRNVIGAVEVVQDFDREESNADYFDIMKRIAQAEWDTLLFFYGVILCVGGLAQFGYLAAISKYMYHDLGATMANALVGILSAIVDNIPVMFAVLTMEPEMAKGQWLLVTLTAGVGGSLLSIGSAAGVALMGSARGKYTFGAHLKWTPVIFLGYVACIICHIVINGRFM